MTAADVKRIKATISSILQKNAGVSPTQVKALLPVRSLQGKLYEAHVLATVIENLVTKEKLTIELTGGTRLTFRQKGGPVSRKYPYFEVLKKGILFGELFTDIYFETLSYEIRGKVFPKGYGDYHELDIALIQPGVIDYPAHDEIILAIECKNTALKKSIIREVLGFRRELSYQSPNLVPTKFTKFPTDQVHANPGSVHMLFCSDNRINRYTVNCLQFGILLEHHKM